MRLAFDIETDGLLPELTKVHCIVLINLDDNVKYRFGPNDYKKGLQMLKNADEIWGHNILGYDIPAIKKLHPNWTFNGVTRDTHPLASVLHRPLGS